MKLDRDGLQAAQLLSEKLTAYKNSNAIVMAILNSGVPIAHYIADVLNLQLEIISCAKIKHPALGMPSIGSVCVDETWIKEDVRNIPQDYIYHQVILLQHALKAKDNFFRGKRSSTSLTGRTVIVIDDVIQTGDTMMGCLKSIKKHTPQNIIVVVPIITTHAAKQLTNEVNRLIYLTLNKGGVNRNRYPAINDDEAKALLEDSVKIPV